MTTPEATSRRNLGRGNASIADTSTAPLPSQKSLKSPANELVEMLNILKVMSDRNRLKILYLLTRGELCVCEIVKALNLPQSLVSHHLGVLRGAALVRDRREGKWIYYSLNRQTLSKLSAKFLTFFTDKKLARIQAQCIVKGHRKARSEV